MVRKKKSGGVTRGKTSGSTKTQIMTGNCPSCGPDSPIARVMVVHTRTRWLWWCSNCCAEVSR